MAYAKLSEQERVSLLMMRGWGDQVRSYNKVRVLFNRTFRNGDGLSPVSKSTVERTVRRFMDNGTVKDLERSGRSKSVASEEKQIEIAQAFVENPHLSLRRTGNEHDASHETVRKVLKNIHFHPCKIHLVQELNEDDPDRRIEFSETMMNRIDEDPLFLYNIVFSDEATFTLKGP
ncbi:uncharacterized protein [Linepithema humile]|uniref:uncharacterized protein n=1 Tax=Linepithema humile TaxID=83485 RepID=UPI00351E8D67